MADLLNNQDRCDWIAAYSEICRINGTAGEHCALQLFALTRMGELAGTFSVHPWTAPHEVYTELEGLFSLGSGKPGLFTRFTNSYSELTGQGIAIDLDLTSYRQGMNYEHFFSDMSLFWKLLPIVGLGISVSAHMLNAICRKLEPATVINVAKSGIISGLKGDEQQLAKQSIVPLMKQCYQAAQSVSTNKSDPYWSEIELAFDAYLLKNFAIADETLMPVFGLGS